MKTNLSSIINETFSERANGGNVNRSIIVLSVTLLTGCATVRQFAFPSPPINKKFMVCGNFQDSYIKRISEARMIDRLASFRTEAVPCQFTDIQSISQLDGKVDSVMILYVSDSHGEQRYIPATTFTSPQFSYGNATIQQGPNFGLGSLATVHASGYTSGTVSTTSGGYAVNEIDMFYGAAVFDVKTGSRTWNHEFEQEFVGKSAKIIAEECAYTIAKGLFNDNALRKQ